MRRVLVVDDFKAWRDKACQIIEAQPDLRVVAQAEDGEEAVQVAAALKPDLVVLDVGLPKLDGLAAAARIFKVSPTTKIVFLSQDNDREIVHAAQKTGASAFVHKTKATTHLLKAIATAIGARQQERFCICPLCESPA